MNDTYIASQYGTFNPYMSKVFLGFAPEMYESDIIGFNNDMDSGFNSETVKSFASVLY